MRVGTLLKQLDAQDVTGEDPETFWEWGRSRAREVRVRWCADAPDCFDVELFDARHVASGVAVTQRGETPVSSRPQMTEPLLRGLKQELVPRLRETLKSRLPEYMIPAAFVVLDALPLISSGKVDRSRLPAPEGREESVPYLAPRTPIEEALARIWMDVLRLDRVGVHDSFFELGGHSLLATRVVAQVRESLGVDLSLRLFFEMPTVSQQADHLIRDTLKSEDADRIGEILATLHQEEVDEH
jgi:acyl carrier protein